MRISGFRIVALASSYSLLLTVVFVYVCCSGRGGLCLNNAAWSEREEQNRRSCGCAQWFRNVVCAVRALYGCLCAGCAGLWAGNNDCVPVCVCLSRFPLSLTPFFSHPSSAFTGAHRFFPSKREGEYVSKIAPSGDFLIYEFFLGDFPYLSSSPHCLVARKPIMTASRERLHVVHGGVWLT